MVVVSGYVLLLMAIPMAIDIRSTWPTPSLPAVRVVAATEAEATTPAVS